MTPFYMDQSNYPKTVVADKRIPTDYITMGNINYVNQEPDNTGVAFSETDRENDWKKNVICHGCGLKGHQLKECNKISPEDKKKIYTMKRRIPSRQRRRGL